MKILFVEKNLLHAKQWLKDNPDALVIFRPSITSNLIQSQAKRYFNDFHAFHSNIQIDWEREIQPKSTDENYFCGWDSFEERQFATGMTCLPQNRLFRSQPCTIPDGFTAFRKKVEPKLPEMYLEVTPSLNDSHQKKLENYFMLDQRASHYFETRNALVGEENSTRFSQALAWGTVDVREIYNQVKLYEQRHGANKSTYWIIFEILWREFFYWHYQNWQTRYFSLNGLKGVKEFTEFRQYELSDLREQIPIPFMKACLNELEHTGYLSNRARQIFASLWLNELKFDWRSGAQLFENHLLDYDVYSNWGNWMYLAGVGVDPRGQRVFDLKKQLSTYDPSGSYLKKWFKETD